MKTKQNSSQLICGISTLFLGIGIACAAEPFENLPADTIIAKVCDHNVSFVNIEPNSAVKSKYQKSEPNEQFKLWLKQTRASNLSRYFKPLWDEYVKEKGLEVTQQEINDCKERMINFLTSQKERQKKVRDSLAKELLAANLGDTKKAELEKSFKLYNSLAERSPDAKLLYQSTDSNSSKVVNNSTKAFILNWKINRELYKQYKGRMIFQQAGLEPLDAYRLFFEEQQSKGKFKFCNKDAEDLFWDYWRNTRHTFIKDPNEIERFINTPPGAGEIAEDYYDDEALWGNDVNGFQIRIKGVRGIRIFHSDKVPTFMMDLLNTGDKTFACPALGQLCEIEVDGNWYKWVGVTVIDILSANFSPKKVQYDFLEIKLNENWVLKEPLKQENQKQSFSLSLGVHTIRVKYKTMYTSGGTETEAVSNSLKFKIIPPKDPKKMN
jgi:hypothetical protein